MASKSSYSNYFNFGGDAEIKTGTKTWIGPAQIVRGVSYDYVSDGRQDTEAAKAFDKIMAGHDATTAQYTNTLKSIYDGYDKYTKEYEGEIRPIIDALGGDIEGMEGYIENYNELLASNKDTFLNGIILDPNSNRTRAEYTGAVADEYDTARGTLKRNMISQGLNPYANKGADREMALSRAKDIGLASGMAYTDWREGYNRDKERQQNATGQYLNLQNNALDAQGKVINARTSIGGFHGNILSSKIAAGQERAKGYEGLTSLAEARRQEALGLGQQQQENARQQSDIKQQLSAKLTKRDKNIAAGGSSYGGYYY